MDKIVATAAMCLLDWSLRGGLMLGLVSLAAVGLKRATPAFRSALLALGFCGILAFPFLTLLAPFRLAPPMAKALAEAAGTAGEPGEDEISFAPGFAGSLETPAAGGFRMDWPGLCLLVWGAGCLVGLARLGAGLYGVRRLKRAGLPPPGRELRTLAARAGAAVGLKKTVPLMMSFSLDTPVAAGAVRPCVIFPHQATAWPPERLHTTLLHELAHVKRRDVFFLILARFAASLFWFNPLAWTALRRLRLEQEQACDDLVTSGGVKPSLYAGHLLATLRAGECRAAAHACLAGGGSQIKRRIERMIRFKPRKPLGSIARYSTWVAVLLCLFLLGSVRIGADNAGAAPANPGSTGPAQALIWPLDGGFKLSSYFGLRYHPIFKEQRFHSGIDLTVKLGTPVRAAADGRVTEAGWQDGYGNLVIIAHPGGRATLYAMLDKINVQAGAEVRQGDAIALSGQSGIATGPHLHFEVHAGNKPVDPLSLLPPLKTAP